MAQAVKVFAVKHDSLSSSSGKIELIRTIYTVISTCTHHNTYIYTHIHTCILIIDDR